MELDPPKGGRNDAMIEVARTLRQSGAVGFVDVNDNPMARARINALMASIAIQREAGIETIPHVCGGGAEARLKALVNVGSLPGDHQQAGFGGVVDGLTVAQ